MYRIEKDTLGEVKVPADKLWGAQTERSRNNFKIGAPASMPHEIIEAFAYLKKLSGKQYASDKAVAILTSLGFEILHQDAASIQVAVPFNKPDISIAADLVEEILRIDGLDNIEIPNAITISPSVDLLETKEQFKNKIDLYFLVNPKVYT